MTDELEDLLERVTELTDHEPSLVERTPGYWVAEVGGVWSSGASTPEAALAGILRALGEAHRPGSAA